jgi:hypothetical protein
MLKRAHANVEHQPLALLNVHSYTTLLSYIAAQDMRVTYFNCAPLQLSRTRPTRHLSGHAAVYQKCRLAATGHQIRADFHIIRHIDSIATRRRHLLITPKSFCRAGSTHIVQSAVETLPATISGDATVAEVAAILRAHREEIEASSKSSRKRRELASARNIGLQALNWLKQLGGLDEQHVVSKECCTDLGWLLVAEGNEQPMTSWFMEEGTRMLGSTLGRVARRTKASFHGSGAYGNRMRRRHDHLAALVNGQVVLSLDGTPAEAIRSLSDVASDATRLGHDDTFGQAGALTVLHKAIKNYTVSPISVSLFDEYLSMIAKMSPKLAAHWIADAKMYHPVAPDPWQMFHRMEGDMAESLRSRKKINRITWDKLGFNHIRLMFLLQLEGAVAEANAVSEVLQEHFAAVWRRRHLAIATLKKDPKLQHLIKQPDYDASSELLELRSRRRNDAS